MIPRWCAIGFLLYTMQRNGKSFLFYYSKRKINNVDAWLYMTKQVFFLVKENTLSGYETPALLLVKYATEIKIVPVNF